MLNLCINKYFHCLFLLLSGTVKNSLQNKSENALCGLKALIL